MTKHDQYYSAPRSPLTHEVGGAGIKQDKPLAVNSAMADDKTSVADKPGELRKPIKTD